MSTSPPPPPAPARASSSSETPSSSASLTSVSVRGGTVVKIPPPPPPLPPPPHADASSLPPPPPPPPSMGRTHVGGGDALSGNATQQQKSAQQEQQHQKQQQHAHRVPLPPPPKFVIPSKTGGVGGGRSSNSSSSRSSGLNVGGTRVTSLPPPPSIVSGVGVGGGPSAATRARTNSRATTTATTASVPYSPIRANADGASAPQANAPPHVRPTPASSGPLSPTAPLPSPPPPPPLLSSPTAPGAQEIQQSQPQASSVLASSAGKPEQRQQDQRSVLVDSPLLTLSSPLGGVGVGVPRTRAATAGESAAAYTAYPEAAPGVPPRAPSPEPYPFDAIVEASSPTSSYHPLLANRQLGLPVLLIPTTDATLHFATRNNFDSLIELFQLVGDYGDIGKEYNMPPFRSVGRTIYFDGAGSSGSGGGYSNTSSSGGGDSVVGGKVSVRFMDNENMDVWSRRYDSENELSSAAHGPDDYDDILGMMELTRIQQQLYHKKKVEEERLLRYGKRHPSVIINDAHGDLNTMKDTPLHEKAAGGGDDDGDEAREDGGVVDSDRNNGLDMKLIERITAAPYEEWMKAVRLVLDRTTDNLPSEMIHCPICILLMASTTEHGDDGDYMQCLRELTSVHHLPRCYGMGQFDSQDVGEGKGGAKRFIVLLHDVHDGMPNFDEGRALRELRSEFQGYECVVLTLNSHRPSSSATENEGPSAANHVDDDGDGDDERMGKYISHADIRILRSFIANNLLKDGIIPTMERRIFHLNAVVSNAKKGVKNVFKSFWRKPKDTSSNSSHGLGGSFHGMIGGAGAGGGSAAGSSLSHGYEVSPGGKISSSNVLEEDYMDSAYQVRYRFDSIESQTRLLADSLFLMKDYETALSFYRLVKDDYKADKALVYYAGIQEMIALCLFMIDGGGTIEGSIGAFSGGLGRYGREIFAAIESACYSYTKSADEERMSSAQQQGGSAASSGNRPLCALMSTRLATRLCLVVSSFTKTKNVKDGAGAGSGGYTSKSNSSSQQQQQLSAARHLDIADLLASASSHETYMGAAVLLEQASGHYLKARLVRKYGFHMLMSGHMYRSCKQERHGMRCFTAALYVYQTANWKELFDHLQSALAQQLYSLPFDNTNSAAAAAAASMFARSVDTTTSTTITPAASHTSMALQFYCRLVGSGTGRISARSQQKFLQHFMEICRTSPRHAMVAASEMRRSCVLAAGAVASGTVSSSNENKNNSNTRRKKDKNNLSSSVRDNEVERGELLMGEDGLDIVEALEIPNMDLPRVLDGTIEVKSASSTNHKTLVRTIIPPTPSSNCGPGVGIGGSSDDVASVASSSVISGVAGNGNGVSGNDNIGLDGVWNELACSMEAEIQASKPILQSSEEPSSLVTSTTTGGEVMEGDEEMKMRESDSIDRVLYELDRVERAQAQLNRKSGKSSAGSGGPTSRSRSEPFTVKVTMANPLGIQLQLTDLQVVAVLKSSGADDDDDKEEKEEENERGVGGWREKKESTKDWICTNERAIIVRRRRGEAIGNDDGGFMHVDDYDDDDDDGREWTFACADQKFLRPSFVRTMKPPCSDSDSTQRMTVVATIDPLFVVDKQSIVMDPGSVQTVAMSVCPMGRGDFEVLGLRCKLFNEVWVYHRFRIQGPLLQDTRLHRANRVRGESHVLNSKVEGEMPLLEIDVRNVKPTSLQGEVNHWTLSIRNIGSADATNVYLKTNLPWVCLDDECSGGNDAFGNFESYCKDGGANPNRNKLNGGGGGGGKESDATSGCVGPSGTLIELPLTRKASDDATGDCGGVGRIKAGEKLDIPIRVRTGGGGKQELHMLFRYDGPDSRCGQVGNNIKLQSTASFSSSHRFLKKLVAISVYPSLTFTASLMPSYWDKQEHVLSIELTNYRSDRQTELDIDLRKVCVASRFYRVLQLGGQQKEEDDPFERYESSSTSPPPHPRGMLIGWQERVTLHFIVVPLEQSRYTLTSCLLSSQVKTGEERGQSYASGCSQLSDFACIENANEKLKAAVNEYREEKARMEVMQEEQQQHPRSIAQIRRQNSKFPRNVSSVAMKNLSSGQKGDGSHISTGGKDVAAVAVGKFSSQPGANATEPSMGLPSSSSLFASPPVISHPTSINSLCPPEEDNSTINVIGVWNAVSCHGEDVTGQHHLLQLPVRPHVRSQGCPLTITAKHPTDVSHNFLSGPLTINLEITVRNRLVPSDDKNDEEKKQQQQYMQLYDGSYVEDDQNVEFEFALMKQPEFEFVGAESFDWTLGGGDELTVPLGVVFSSGGIYNVQSVRLTICEDGGVAASGKRQKVPYLFPLQWVVQVKDISS